LHRVVVVVQQVVSIGPSEVRPGQQLIAAEPALGCGFEIQAGLGEGFPPQRVVETITPQVEPGPASPGGFDDLTAASVGATYGRFENALLYLVKLEHEELGPQAEFLVDDDAFGLFEVPVRPFTPRRRVARR